MSSQARRKNIDCFQPSSQLVDIMQQLLQFMIKKRDMKHEILAAEKKELTEEDIKQIETQFANFRMNSTFRSKINRVINDIVFPSMANLIIFFSYAARIESIENELSVKKHKNKHKIATINQIGENEHMFDKYLQELLLGYNPKSGGDTLYRLINGMLSLNDLKYIIFQTLQEEIFEMLKIARRGYSKDDSFEYVILPDMVRAMTHARSLANEAISEGVVNFNRNNRPVLF
jgi:hypothetical protein